MSRFSLFSRRQTCAQRNRRKGYTLVEAMVGLSLTAMAGAVVLLAVETSLDAADQALQQTVAAGLAEQLADEILGAMYYAPGANPYQSSLGPDEAATQGDGREQFDEIGDYDGYGRDVSPPEDRWGAIVGQGDDRDPDATRHPNFAAPTGAFDGWRQQVEVYYVDPDNPFPDDPSDRLGEPSDYRAIEVVISRELATGEVHELARVRRVVTFLPPVPDIP